MDMKTYLEDSARTAAGEMHLNRVANGYIVEALEEFVSAAKKLDGIKKAIFYNRDTLEHTNQSYKSEPLEDIETDLAHSIIGIATESGELLELLLEEWTGGDKATAPKITDESGDLLWYQAMLLRLIKSDFETAAGKNLTKLKIRFPEKFTFDRVNNKDHTAEDKAFAT